MKIKFIRPLATLLVVPALFAILQGEKTRKTVSLDPDDPGSRYFERGATSAKLAEDNGRLLGVPAEAANE